MVLACGLLAACTPSHEEFAAADFGDFPTYYDKTVDRWLERQLIDPESRRVDTMREPQQYFWAFSNPKYGYLVCGSVNAKNRMGGYAGRSNFWAMLRGDRVVSGGIADGGRRLSLAPKPCIEA